MFLNSFPFLTISMKTLLRIIATAAACTLGSSALAANFRTVVIDPGHGGHDRGGQWGKVYEKHLALDTSVRLENHLKKMGYQTVLTRRSDYFVTLPQRVNIANRYKNAIFISVHYNYTWKQHVSGLETFYYTREGQKLAHYVQSSLVRHTRTVDRSAKFARYYVIRNSNIPAILVEGGFVSNETERNRMKSAYFREAVARGIAEGIQRYRRSN
jgi:N-acetylmuramoyl-L-alanine amidase